MVIDLAAIVPLPDAFVGYADAIFAPLAGEAPLVRVALTMGPRRSEDTLQDSLTCISS